MRRGTWLLTGLGWCVLFAGCSSDPATPSTPDAATGPTQAEIIARGKYLSDITGCDDCHTPWVKGTDGIFRPDETLPLSGHPASLVMGPRPTGTVAAPWVVTYRSATRTAWAAPAGTAYSPNLTSDRETGWLEGWNADDFIEVMRTSMNSDGRTLVGPMLQVTWRMAKATDDDLRAIFAYLRSVPAIANQVPDFEPLADAGVQ